MKQLVPQRNDTLWASWAVTSPTGGSVWFGGDTGYKSGELQYLLDESNVF